MVICACWPLVIRAVAAPVIRSEEGSASCVHNACSSACAPAPLVEKTSMVTLPPAMRLSVTAGVLTFSAEAMSERKSLSKRRRPLPELGMSPETVKVTST